MLEFYLISDDQITPSYPEELNLTWAGRLDLKTFNQLQKKGWIGKEWSYFEDFRWHSLLVKSMLIEESTTSDSDLISLKTILANAVAKELGLVAFCD